jgi:hydroxypyruvate isomerase
MHWPYDVPVGDIKAALAQSRMPILALNTPVGNTSAGDFGLGALPGRENEFRQAFETALSYGAEVGANAVHCMAGVVPTELHAAAESTFVENLRAAADMAAQASMTLLLEPINHRDKPGYFLQSVEQAAWIIEKVGRANVKIMFDCYHTQITQGDLIRRLERNLGLIGHVQIAGVPDRAEPDEGEVNYPEILRALDRIGYDGWIGAEYKPRGQTQDGLAWLSAWSRQ